jgi:hypothetical protein
MGDNGSIDEALQALGSHARLEDLRAHREGRLTRAEAERIAAHIGHCPSCAEWAGDLESFLGPPHEPTSGEPVPDPEEIWRNVAKVLGRAGSDQPKAAPRLSLARFRESGLPALAAGLLIATVLSTWAWLLAQRQAARLTRGEVNVPILVIDQELRRQAENGAHQPPFQVPPGAVLVVTPPLEPQPIDHEVRISLRNGHAGRLVWSEQGLRPTPQGSFHLQLPRDLRPGETYRLQIVPGEGQEVAIHIVAPDRR